MKAEEILKEKFPNASELDWFKPITDAMKIFATQREDVVAVAFDLWKVKKLWNPLNWNDKIVWIDCKIHKYYLNGSDTHFDSLLEIGLTTSQLFAEFKESDEYKQLK